MCSLIAVAFGTKVAATIMQGTAAKQRGDAAMRSDYQSADAAERSAADAIERGKLKDLQVVMRTSRVVGAQRVAFSGTGADVNVGAPQATERATEGVSDVDRKTVARNATLEAFGLTSRARAFRQEGQYAKAEGENAMIGTFLSGFGSAAGSAGRIGADIRTPEDSEDSGETPDQQYRDGVLREEH